MENYEAKLLSLGQGEMPLPRGTILFSELATLASANTALAYERELRRLASRLQYKTSSWPEFGGYVEDWYRVEVSDFKKQLLYCERGSCQVREDCENIIDLSYHVLKVVAPSLTSSAAKVAEELDRIKDQRLLVWLQMSSEIYQMYQVNSYFGLRALNANVFWMCEELVRMGLFENASDAFKNEIHIIQGLQLSGMPKGMASKLYLELKSA